MAGWVNGWVGGWVRGLIGGWVGGFFIFIYLLTFSMLHYIVTLQALELNIHNTVTYIYHLCTISSVFYSYGRLTFSFLI